MNFKKYNKIYLPAMVLMLVYQILKLFEVISLHKTIDLIILAFILLLWIIYTLLFLRFIKSNKIKTNGETGDGTMGETGDGTMSGCHLTQRDGSPE